MALEQLPVLATQQSLVERIKYQISVGAPLVIVKGPMGSGKTVICEQIISAADDARYVKAFIPGATAHDLGRYREMLLNQISPDGSVNANERVIGSVQKMDFGEKRVLIVIDDFDHVAELFADELAEVCGRYGKEKLFTVVATASKIKADFREKLVKSAGTEPLEMEIKSLPMQESLLVMAYYRKLAGLPELGDRALKRTRVFKAANGNPGAIKNLVEGRGSGGAKDAGKGAGSREPERRHGKTAAFFFLAGAVCAALLLGGAAWLVIKYRNGPAPDNIRSFVQEHPEEGAYEGAAVGIGDDPNVDNLTPELNGTLDNLNPLVMVEDAAKQHDIVISDEDAPNVPDAEKELAEASGRLGELSGAAVEKLKDDADIAAKAKEIAAGAQGGIPLQEGQANRSAVEELKKAEADARQELSAKQEAERKAAEEKARQEQLARQEAERKAAEEKARQEQLAKEEAERKAAEEKARQEQLAKEEAERKAAEEKARQEQLAKEEAERKAAEEKARQEQLAKEEAERKAAEEKARQEQLAKEEAERKAAEEKARQEQLAKEEAERKAAEEKARQEQLAKEEAERKAAEEKARREQLAKEEAERKAAEEKARQEKLAKQEAERKAAEEKARQEKLAKQEAERKAAEEKARQEKLARQEAERKAAEEKARQEKLARQEAERKAAEEKARQEKLARQEAERKAAEEKARKEQIAKLEEAKRVEARIKDSGREFAGLNDAHYTVQLVATSRKEEAYRIAELAGNSWVLYRPKDKQYIVMHGDFNDRAAAAKSVASLPASIRKAKPWAKNVAAVKKEIQ